MGPTRSFNPKDPVTDWITDENPVRPGVYQRMFQNGDARFSYWDGRMWYWAHRSAYSARVSYEKNHPSANQRHLPWRGLALQHNVTPQQQWFPSNAIHETVIPGATGP